MSNNEFVGCIIAALIIGGWIGWYATPMPPKCEVVKVPVSERVDKVYHQQERMTL